MLDWAYRVRNAKHTDVTQSTWEDVTLKQTLTAWLPFLISQNCEIPQLDWSEGADSF